jgi:hypothetical protein
MELWVAGGYLLCGSLEDCTVVRVFCRMKSAFVSDQWKEHFCVWEEVLVFFSQLFLWGPWLDVPKLQIPTC